jgi:hypothetical protein
LVDVRELGRDALLREVEHDLLGPVDELDRLARPVEAEPGDVVAGSNQATQGGHLADDARVVGRVRGRRNEGCQLVHALLAAGRVERGGTIQLVHDGDRVDRLALRGEHHRAEDRLLGVEVLRWDRGGGESLGRCCHVSPSRAGAVLSRKGVESTAQVGKEAVFTGIIERLFASR